MMTQYFIALLWTGMLVLEAFLIAFIHRLEQEISFLPIFSEHDLL